MSKKSLVIGANSFIGSNLIRLLQSSSTQVTGVYNSNKDRLPKDIRCVAVKQLEELEADFRDVYIIAAFIASGQLDTNARTRMFEANVSLVGDMCAKFKDSRIILCSSVSVYGAQPVVITEESSKGGLNEYGVSKLWSEKIVSATDNFAIVRLPSVFGPAMNPNTIIPLYIRQALVQKEITVYGEGERLQNYLHVKDAAGFLKAAADYQGNDEFLACAPRSISNLELAQIIAEETGCAIGFKGVDRSPSFSYDNSLTSKKLMYHPGISFREGIKELIQWSKEKF